MAPNDHCRGTVASGPAGAASASDSATSWVPGHAYTGTGQSKLSSNVDCQMPCVFDPISVIQVHVCKSV